ncbi:hypothetical protein VNN38_01010 [Lactococcus petauri]|uniref:Uncharacterized protein n=1 Tax=Lactococcus petauri TaxID=1940789 RepID=A0ABZ2SFG4_9LACT
MAKVGKKYADNKVTQTILPLSIVGLKAVSITKNNTKVTPRKGTRFPLKFLD